MSTYYNPPDSSPPAKYSLLADNTSPIKAYETILLTENSLEQTGGLCGNEDGGESFFFLLRGKTLLQLKDRTISEINLRTGLNLQFHLGFPDHHDGFIEKLETLLINILQQSRVYYNRAEQYKKYSQSLEQRINEMQNLTKHQSG